MPQISGRTIAVVALSTFFIAAGLFFVTQNNDPRLELIESTALGRSGIRDLDVEYSEGKIYLNVELITPRTCAELIDSLRIQPLVIKTRTYQPTCSVISNTLIRITYTQSITI
jgi:hypothetical protein